MTRGLLFILGFLPGLALACQPQQLFDLMQQRLGYMPVVAANKQEAGRPIEDLAREDLVLQRSLEKAIALGLASADAEQFIRGQITAAKQVQQRHAIPGTLSLAQIREQLLALGDQQLQQLHCLRQTGWSAAAADWPVFRQSFPDELLDAKQLRQLFLALPASPL